MRSISESERFQKPMEVFEVKKTWASCSKKAKWRLQKQLRLTKIIGPTPIIFFVLSKINQYACIILLPWPYFFWGGGSGIGRYGVRPTQDTLGSRIYRTKMSKKSSCSSTFQVCVSSTMHHHEVSVTSALQSEPRFE